MRALRDRPTALERWTSGVRPGMKLATGPHGQGRRRVLPEAGAQGRARLPRVRRDHLPLGPHRRRDLPDRDRGAGVVRAHGHADLPPVAGAPRRRRPPRRAAHRPRPAAGHDVHRRGAGRRGRPRAARGARAARATRRPRGNRGVHVYVRIEPRWEFVDVRHAAIGFGRELEKRDDGVTTAWWKEERGERIFVDFNQNCRDRTIASAYSLRPIPGAPVSTPMTWEELAGVTDPRRVQPVHRARPAAPTATRGPTIDDAALLARAAARAVRGAGRRSSCNYPPDYPKMPGEPPRVQPSKKVAAHWDDDGNRIGPSVSAGQHTDSSWIAPRGVPAYRWRPVFHAAGSAEPRGSGRSGPGEARRGDAAPDAAGRAASPAPSSGWGSYIPQPEVETDERNPRGYYEPLWVARVPQVAAEPDPGPHHRLAAERRQDRQEGRHPEGRGRAARLAA